MCCAGAPVAPVRHRDAHPHPAPCQQNSVDILCDVQARLSLKLLTITCASITPPFNNLIESYPQLQDGGACGPDDLHMPYPVMGAAPPHASPLMHPSDQPSSATAVAPGGAHARAHASGSGHGGSDTQHFTHIAGDEAQVVYDGSGAAGAGSAGAQQAEGERAAQQAADQEQLETMLGAVPLAGHDSRSRCVLF